MLESINKVDLVLFTSQGETTYLLTAFACNGTISSYFSGVSNLAYPLKKEWQQAFLSQGIKVNKIMCSLLRKIYIFIMSVRDVSIYFKHLLQINDYHLSRRFTEAKANSNFLNVYFSDISTRSLSTFGTKVFEKILLFGTRNSF